MGIISPQMRQDRAVAQARAVVNTINGKLPKGFVSTETCNGKHTCTPITRNNIYNAKFTPPGSKTQLNGLVFNGNKSRFTQYMITGHDTTSTNADNTVWQRTSPKGQWTPVAKGFTFEG
jgi:hypothetical protein